MADLKISQFVDGDLVQVGDEIAAVRAGDNVKVGVGSAAAADTGTNIGDIPILIDVGGSPGFPALDGSNLTNIASGGAKVTVTDANGGYLDDKLKPGVLLTTEVQTDSSGNEILVHDVRSRIATAAFVSSGTHTVDIADGDFHPITATGVFTLAWQMEQGQSVLVRGMNFNSFSPIDGLDWGAAGAPTWTAKDDFIVYRDMDGNYIGALIVSGIS